MNQTMSVNRCYSSVVTPGLRLAEIFYPPGGRQKAHWHVDSTITLIASGSLEEGGPNGPHHARAASVVFKPARTVHSDVFGPAGARTLQIRLPAPSVSDPIGWTTAVERYSWVDGGPLARSLLRLYRIFAGAEVSTELLLEETLCDIAAIAVPQSRDSLASDRPAWMRRVVDRLSSNALAPPRVSELATEAGVHPVYLARAFRRHQRCSIGEFVRRQRVGEVCRRLTTSSTSLASIALESGFSDQSHLCRVFRAELGLTPSAYRKLVRVN
jgi:AraC family transcriptional regulator